MGTIEDIEKAVSELSPEELARFTAWFEEFEAARFDAHIEADAKAGKLDKLIAQAREDYRAARVELIHLGGSEPDLKPIPRRRSV